MTSNTSQVVLCNRSLLAIGGKAQVSSINPSDGSRAGDACSILFVPTFEQLGRSAWWNCLQKQAPLSLYAAAANTPENPNGTPPFPPTPFLYEYLYPTDCLKARSIIPTFPAQNNGGPPPTTASVASPIWIRGLGQIPFKVRYDTDANGNPLTVIVTDQSQAQLLYTVNQQNPVLWDPQFQEAFVASLAAYLVPALSLHMPLMQANIAIAERMIAEARASDGNEDSNSQDHVPDWMRARSGGADGFYSGYWGGGGCGWDDMCWPGYGV